MKILLHSNWPLAPTGYGQQTALFAPRFRDLGHDVALSACWGFSCAALEWEGMRVYPADDQWGNRTLAAFAAQHAGDGDLDDVLVITLVDVYVMDSPSLNQLRIAAWCPVDHDPVPPNVAAFFERTGAAPVAMSRFGERALRDKGLDPLYVPHGIDTNVFRPRDRAQARERARVPQDAFVVGMVAANKGISPSRKAFPQVFQAFARFRETQSDAILYLHAERAGRHGVNLDALRDACGIPRDAVMFTDQLQMEFGFDPDDLAEIYSLMDVLAAPSFGEGFGIPIVEAQACGTPVIVNQWTAMPELCGAGWVVDGDEWYDPAQVSFFKAPSIDELVFAFDAAYDRRGDLELRDRARAFAVGYDVDRVLREFWVPALERLEGGRGREVPALEAVA